VPTIVAAPGLAPAVCETPVDLLDLFPTLLTAAGVDPSSDMQDRPGQSLFDIAATLGREAQRRFQLRHSLPRR
jgi:choline-sulfatase